jgi:PAS domain S-box-containing protein
MITRKDHTKINEFINDITKVRLETGFPLEDIQKAFELYRHLILPLLVKESPGHLLCRNIEVINTGLAYTIHRFSHHFQKTHETYLKNYADQLEKDVATRTAELKVSELKYKTLVEDISDGYLVLDKEKINFVNPAFVKMHGYTKDDPLSKSFMSFVAKAGQAKVKDLITQDIEPGIETDAFAYKRLTKDKQHLPTEISFRPSFFKGKPYTLCILRDIQKRVAMEKKSRETERMAYIGKLTASLSHEMRNPLSSVKMNLQILNKSILLKGNDRERLQISEQEIKRLEDILRELLNFAKPVSLQLTPTNINHIIYYCVELLEIKLYRKSIDYKINIDRSLKEILVDKGKIEQLIINLILNALDSVDDFGKIIISTTKNTHKGQRFFVIKVADDGKGIPQEVKANIFEPFYTTKTNGTGLGLANVKRIVEAHHGTIKIVDIRGGGTSFNVFIPMGATNG